MSIEQHIPQNAGNDWINSLERAVEICRDQISFARAMKVEKIAVPADSLEKILDALPAATPTTSAAIEAAKAAAERSRLEREVIEAAITWRTDWLMHSEPLRLAVDALEAFETEARIAEQELEQL